MNFYLRLIRLAIRGLGASIKSQKSLLLRLQKELNKAVLNPKNIPQVQTILKGLKTSDIAKAKELFKILNVSPEQALQQLIKTPKTFESALSKTLDKLDPEIITRAEVIVDEIEPLEGGALTKLIPVSSSWIRAIQYKQGPNKDTVYFYFETKTGKGPYGPDIILKETLTRMLNARGQNGTGAGTVMWREVPHWVAKRRGFNRGAGNIALRGFR